MAAPPTPPPDRGRGRLSRLPLRTSVNQPAIASLSARSSSSTPASPASRRSSATSAPRSRRSSSTPSARPRIRSPTALADERDLARRSTSSRTAPRAASISPPATGRPRTLEDEAEDLAAIGQALGAARNVNLWSCQTAAGPAGAAFIAGLARASGADIAAATGLVGAAALGRKWELMATACPPLTDAGMAGYAGVLATTLTSTGRGQRFSIFGSWPLGTGAGTYFVVLNNSGQSEVLGKFIVPTNVTGTFVVSADLPAGSYTLGSNNVGPGTITVYNGKRRSRRVHPREPGPSATSIPLSRQH